MKKELVIITCQPSDLYYIWQTQIFLESCKEKGYLSACQILIYHNTDKNKPELPKEWKQLSSMYPEARFFIYEDNQLTNLLSLYEPIIRPHTLARHFKQYKYLSKCAVFYCDCDIVLTEKFNIEKFIDDDINYLSDTKSYINSDYFDSKVKDVLPEKLDAYKKRDILDEVAKFSGIDRAVCEQNKENAGGAQYLLKNITYRFWEKVFESCIYIRIHLVNVNIAFFKDEDKGFQSWCADMWAVLHTLWAMNRKTKIVPELNFSWATSFIEEYDKNPIYHNAGITSDSRVKLIKPDKDGNRWIDCPAFYKQNYKSISPFGDIESLKLLLESPQTKEICNSKYVEKIIELKNKYSINY